MKNRIKIEIEIDESLKEPEVVIRTDKDSAFVERIVAAIERCGEEDRSKVTAYKDNVISLLSQKDIIRVYTEQRKLVVSTVGDKYESKSTLKDLEAMLDPKMFVRISRFEIVNLNKVTGFDFSVAGTIKVLFDDGSSTWVARRYVRAIEQKLSQM